MEIIFEKFFTQDAKKCDLWPEIRTKLQTLLRILLTTVQSKTHSFWTCKKLILTYLHSSTPNPIKIYVLMRFPIVFRIHKRNTMWNTYIDFLTVAIFHVCGTCIYAPHIRYLENRFVRSYTHTHVRILAISHLNSFDKYAVINVQFDSSKNLSPLLQLSNRPHENRMHLLCMCHRIYIQHCIRCALESA